ncbi:hypothetical protein HDV00_003666 [Rhizophlyctis rosea]|nr:hypothetical protein HDV00_003666 [Rhizophlyctis rosea]
MATVQTLPDILIHLFSSPNVSVADLLKCERVCRQWCALIRNNQVQIWRAKVVEEFPEGCLPVRYGEEVWRDVAILWWAWRRLGSSGRGMEVNPVGEGRLLGGSETLTRRGDGVVRELASAHSPDFSHPYPFAVRPTGDSILQMSDINLPKVLFDNVFTPKKVISRPTQHFKSPVLVNHIRSNVIECTTPDGGVGYEDWVASQRKALPPLAGADTTVICRNQILRVHTRTDETPTAIIKTFSIENPSFVIERRTGPHWPEAAINETVLAYIPKPFAQTLYLVRLKDNKQLASYSLPRELLYYTDIRITRFIVLIWCHPDLLIFDMKLNLLCKLPCPIRLPGREREYEFLKVEDWMIIWERGFDEFLVFDPMEGSYQVVRHPDESEGNDDGYQFSTIEYPIDEKGRRTGARGVVQHYWRWLKKWNQ